MPEEIVLEKDRQIATISFNRPERDNAVGPEMMQQLHQALADVASQEGLRLLVLEGRGDHFCAGREPGSKRPPNAARWAEVLRQIVRVNQLLRSFSGITMAVVRGKAFGFGCGLAVQSDVTLAADNARFAFPEMKHGLPPTIVMSYLGRWIHRKKAFEMVLTGADISAHEAEALGLVNRVVPLEGLQREKENWMGLCLGYEKELLETCKQFFRDTARSSPEEAVRYAVSLLANFLSSREEK